MLLLFSGRGVSMLERGEAIIARTLGILDMDKPGTLLEEETDEDGEDDKSIIA